MPRRSIFLSGLFLVLGLSCWAQRDIGNSPSLSISTFAQRADFLTSHSDPLALTWLALIDNKDKGDDKDSDKTSKTPAEKIWVVLNSPVGVWALGSVVLALIIKAYSAREARKAENLKRVDTATRLDTEIAFRLAMALDGLRINEARLESSPTTPRGIHQNAYDYLENAFITFAEPNKGRDFSVFPEYKDRTFRALILELRTVVDAHDEPDLRQALHAYEQLSEGGDIGSEDSSPKSCHDAFATVRDLLQNQLVRPRWRKRVDFLSVTKR